MTLTPEQRDAWRANAIQGGTGWPHETLALLDALDEAERAVAYVHLVQAVAAVTPCSCSAQRARADRAEAERDRLHSQAVHWRLRAEQAEAALRSIPGYTTPEHFRGAVEALIREENAAEAARDTAERQVKAVRELHRPGEVYTLTEECSDPDSHQWSSAGHGGDDICLSEPTGEKFCTECAPDDTFDRTDFPWPCPTIRALDGEAG